MIFRRPQIPSLIFAVLIFSTAILVCIAILLPARAPLHADAPFVLSGYAWANTGNPNEGLGWISLSCTDGGPTRNNICATSNYGVMIAADMSVSGYAWDDHVGWVSFENLPGCPSGTCGARVISDGGTGYELSGWARACTVFAAGCSGMLKADSERGGWDGWISLNCENDSSCGTSDYTIRISNSGNVASGASDTGSFAWGDSVTGWIDFGQANLDNICSINPSYSCNGNISEMNSTNIWCEPDSMVPTDCTLSGQVCNPADGTCVVPAVPVVNSFTVIPTVIRRGGEAMISWDVANTSSCRVLGSDNSSQTGGSDQSVNTNPLTNNRTTFTLSCQDTAGTWVTLASTTVQLLATFYE